MASLEYEHALLTVKHGSLRLGYLGQKDRIEALEEENALLRQRLAMLEEERNRTMDRVAQLERNSRDPTAYMDKPVAKLQAQEDGPLTSTGGRKDVD